jgi:hypothetical protein
MNILKTLKQAAAAKQVVGSVLNAAPAPSNKKAKAAAVIAVVAAAATAAVQYL